MASRHLIAHELAALLLAGAWSPRRLEARAVQYLGKSAKQAQKRLIEAVIAGQTTDYPPSPRRLTEILLASPAFDRAAARVLKQKQPPKAVLNSPAFAPAPAFAGIGVPKLATPGELAAWLELPIGRLDWLADSRRQHARADVPELQNYAYSFVAKRSGPPRLIESPKPNLKAIQRRILHEMLDLAPTHAASHGFVRGRSCISGAQVHAGEHVVLCVDLKDFFPRIAASRIHGLFRGFGYPWAVARLLTDLCTTMTPASVFACVPEVQRHDWMTRKMFGAPHLPQGAPTSPALANLCTWRLDQRLSTLARALNANYTRYADDLSFSGDEAFARRVQSYVKLVEEIVCEEGFRVNARKTRVMRRSGRQRVTGIVVNEHANVARVSYDELRAILHNCQRRGPEAENRAARADFKMHLDGRVAWVEQVNPQRGVKLRRLFERIKWEAPQPE